VIAAINAHQRNRLPTLIGIVVAVGLVKALCTVGRRLISGKQALGVELDLRNAIYAKLVRLSFGYFDRRQTGQLMSRATVDLQSVRFFLGYGLIFFFQHVFTVVGVGVLLFVISWKLALVALAFSPVLVAVAYRYSNVSHPVLRDVQQRMADVATVAEESIVGVHVVKAFAQEQAEQDKFERRSEALFSQSVRANRQRAFYVPVLSFLPLLGQAAVLVVGGEMVVRSKSLSVQDFVAFNLYLSMIVFPLRMLGMWIGEGQRATASGERIFQILDEPEEIRDRPDAGVLPAGPGRVAFEGVTFGYEPLRPVLEGIELELEPGKIVALIGHTGSGKTTLASLIPRFYDVQAGRVTIDGSDIRDVTLTSLRREIGVIAQDPFLFSATVRENLTFGRPDATDEEMREAAQRAQAHEFVERLPNGYDTVIGERGVTLSGGQRQRLAIARALVVDPRILILDDATASVDPSTEARIRSGLREAMRGRTTLIIAHRLSTIALADEIVALDHGRITATGTHEEMLETSAVYREIYEHGRLDRSIAEQEVA
jgi:ATP-binding cassette subfamily B protein